MPPANGFMKKIKCRQQNVAVVTDSEALTGSWA
jgi:hypothetical protein